MTSLGRTHLVNCLLIFSLIVRGPSGSEIGQENNDNLTLILVQYFPTSRF